MPSKEQVGAVSRQSSHRSHVATTHLSLASSSSRHARSIIQDMHDLPPPPPPYAPTKQVRVGPANLSSIPVNILHRIISLTLDHKVTPSRFMGDAEEERVRRIFGLFYGLKGVDRRFYLVSTSILRSLYLPSYSRCVKRGNSSAPIPEVSLPLEDGPVQVSVLEYRKRETAILDRYIAVKVGEELRQVESALSEDSGELDELFHRHQPCARIEDLLFTLPSSLISLQIPQLKNLRATPFPLPHSNISITLTPSWVQATLHSRPVWEPGSRARELIVEVRREQTLEACARSIGEGLQDLKRGLIAWGEKVR